jgi:hypothetical protein
MKQLDSKKPGDQTREDDKLQGPIQKSAKSCRTRSYVQLGEKLTKDPHAEGEGSRRLRNRRRAKEAGNWAGMGPGRSASLGPGHLTL